ncbi:MAG: helix-turn-helix domain-containing protein [Spirochaetia bacterium]|jgi:molybdate-binding protein/DNA-binding XRE family transcriptional regulator|nr:helix-turn-helix domain-containing protein [Spirochaetia bacterium]
MNHDDDVSLIVCSLKELRQKKGYTQLQMAEMLGIKRQAVYDIESGRYLPNTLIALRLAKVLNVAVEDIFEEKTFATKNVKLLEDAPADSRLSVVKVRSNLVGYPLKNKDILGGISPDGLYIGDGRVRLLKNEPVIENSIALLGCDPAFNILSSYVSDYDTHMHYRFASSKKALESLADGLSHIAGIHMQSGDADDNLNFARRIMKEQKFGIITFADYEEGLIVAPGNPLKINSPEDLTNPDIRFVNREPGAAVRFHLEEILKEKNIPYSAIPGFDKCVFSHAEGAQLVEYGLADAVLGLRSVVEIYNVGFIPLSAVRCDLVIPADFWEIKPVKLLLDVLQGKRLRLDLKSAAGYNADNTGRLIAEP